MDQQPGYTFDNYPGRTLAIAGLILAILSMMTAFIPLVGVLALLPALAGLICALLAIVRVQKAKAPNGIAISGLVCSLLAACIALIQLWFLHKVSQEVNEFKQSGGFDTLSVKMKNLKLSVDSMWHKEMESEKK